MTKGGPNDVERAKELATAISDRNNPPSVDAMNRIYDVVLNMNSLNSKPSGSDGKVKPHVFKCSRYHGDDQTAKRGDEQSKGSRGL